MTTDSSIAGLKHTSCLRRARIPEAADCVAVAAHEGAICAFEVAPGPQLVVEDRSGRALTLLPGDVFLGTAGFRESTRFAVGGVSPEGLVPGTDYSILSPSGIVGELFGRAPLEQPYLGRVTYLGTIRSAEAGFLSLQQFSIAANAGAPDRIAPIYLVLGTSAEAGKTTAALAILRSLLHRGHSDVVAVKATGTSSYAELLDYADFGAGRCFDCIDFGLPSTYPSEREGIEQYFDRLLDFCLSLACEDLIIECGGDILGANVPVFLHRLSGRRRDLKVVLAAPDALAAMGAKLALQEFGLSPTLITGPCTDTPTLQQRTQAYCGIPAMNMAAGSRAP